MNTIQFLFIEHFSAASQAALFFFCGALGVIPMIRWNPSGCQAIFGWMMRIIVRLFGPKPGLLRLAATIFLFNTTAMFVYLSLSVHPVVPKLIAFITGFTLALAFSVPEKAQGSFELSAAAQNEWVPKRSVAIGCAAATLIIELTCFFYTIGMGITLGQRLINDRIHYLSGLQVRALAYLTIVPPLLLLSAVCETVAIRAGAHTE